MGPKNQVGGSQKLLVSKGCTISTKTKRLLSCGAQNVACFPLKFMFEAGSKFTPKPHGSGFSGVSSSKVLEAYPPKRMCNKSSRKRWVSPFDFWKKRGVPSKKKGHPPNMKGPAAFQSQNFSWGSLANLDFPEGNQKDSPRPFAHSGFGVKMEGRKSNPKP